MTLLEEFALLLASRGLGEYNIDGQTGGTIFLSASPSEPDECITIARYGGPESDSRQPSDEPRIQIRVRGTATDSRDAERTAQDVYDLVHGLGPLALPGGTRLILAVGAGGGPAYIGRDQNGRHEWVVNIRARIRRPTANRP